MLEIGRDDQTQLYQHVLQIILFAPHNLRLGIHEVADPLKDS